MKMRIPAGAFVLPLGLLILGSTARAAPLERVGPLPGGPIRALIASDILTGPAVGELAARLDLKAETVFLDSDWVVQTGATRPELLDRLPLALPGAELYRAAFEELAAKLRRTDFEVIVLPTFRGWDSYPEGIRKAVLERVRGGAGLILFRPVCRSGADPYLAELSPFARASADSLDPHGRLIPTDLVNASAPFQASGGGDIAGSVPLGELAGLRLRLSPLPVAPGSQTVLSDADSKPILATRKVGKGRVAAFTFDSYGLIPRVRRLDLGAEIDPDCWESYWLLLSRTIHRISGRGGQAAVIDPVLSLPEDGGRSEIELRFRLMGAPAGLRLEARTRPSSRTGGSEKYERTAEIELKDFKPGRRLRLPVAWYGDRATVDFRLLSPQGVVDWGSGSVSRKTSLDRASILPGRRWFLRGDPILIGLELACESGGEFRVQSELWDGWGRVVETGSAVVPVQGTMPIFPAIRSQNLETRPARVVFRIDSGDDTIKVLSQPIIVRPKGQVWDDWFVFQPYTPRNYPGIEVPWQSEIEARLAGIGVAITDDPVGPFGFYVRARRKWESPDSLFQAVGIEMPEAGDLEKYLGMKRNYLATGNPEWLVRDDLCLSFEESGPAVSGGYTDLVRRSRAFGPLLYELAFQPTLTCGSDPLDVCRSRFCHKYFGKYLFAKYKDFDLMNRIWQVNLHRWPDIRPITAEEARRKGPIIAWEEHRTFNELNMLQWVERLADVIKVEDPGALAGFSIRGADGVHNGIDPGRLDPIVNVWGEPDETRRGRFDPSAGAVGLGRAGEAPADAALRPWRALAAGLDGYRLPPLFSLFDARLEPTGTAAAAFAALEAIDRGPGRLLAEAEPEAPVVLIHHSMRSLHLAWLADGRIEEGISDARSTSPTLDLVLRDREAWGKILDNLGVPWRLVSSEEIASGRLDPQWETVLILPNSMMLSEEEIDGLQEFLEGGGHVIADGWTGIFGRYLHKPSPNRANAILGLEGERDTTLKLSASDPQPVSFTGEWPESADIRGLELAQISDSHKPGPGALVPARFPGGPAIIMSRDGRTVYLNGLLADYLDPETGAANRRALLALVERLVERAGIAPRLRLTDAGGARCPDVIARNFNLGEFDILGLVDEERRPGAGSKEVRVRLGKSVYYRELVRGGKPAGPDSILALTLDRGEAVICLMSTVPPRRLSIECPRQARGGEAVTIAVGGGEDGPLPDGYPLRLRGYRPDGTEEMSLRSAAFGDGSSEAVFNFLPALNAMTGEWRLVVGDLYSGIDYPLSLAIR